MSTADPIDVGNHVGLDSNLVGLDIFPDASGVGLDVGTELGGVTDGKDVKLDIVNDVRLDAGFTFMTQVSSFV